MVPATVGCTAAGLAGGVVDFADDAAALAGVPDGDVPEGDALVAGALVFAALAVPFGYLAVRLVQSARRRAAG